MSRAYDDSRYLARTLVATLLDLEPHDQDSVLAYFRDELRRLGVCDGSAQTPQQGSPGTNGQSPQDSVAGAAPPTLQDFNVFIIGTDPHHARFSTAIGAAGPRSGDHAAMMTSQPAEHSDREQM
ncbi:MAG: hypothetical protein ACM3L9_07115 [Deltaproteobacteria bacterium]